MLLAIYSVLSWAMEVDVISVVHEGSLAVDVSNFDCSNFVSWDLLYIKWVIIIMHYVVSINKNITFKL